MTDNQREPNPQEQETNRKPRAPVQTKTVVLSLVSSAVLISFALYTLIKTDFKTYPKTENVDIESITKSPEGFADDEGTPIEVVDQSVLVVTPSDEDHSVVPHEEPVVHSTWGQSDSGEANDLLVANENLVAELAFLKDRNLTLEYQISDRDREISSLRDQVHATHELLQVASTTLHSDSAGKIADEQADMAEEHARLTEQHETLQKHYGRIEGALADARVLLRESQQSQQVLEDKVREAEAKGQDQETKRSETEGRLKELSKRVDTLQKDKAILQDKIAQQQQTLYNQEGAFQELANAVKTYKEAIKRMDQSRMELASELDATKKQYAKLLQAAGSQSQATAKQTNDKPFVQIVASNVDTPTGVVSQSPTSEGEVRYHVVGKGDTLTSISRHYYGTAQRWHEIYDANKAVITDHNRLKVGLVLVVP